LTTFYDSRMYYYSQPFVGHVTESQYADIIVVLSTFRNFSNFEFQILRF